MSAKALLLDIGGVVLLGGAIMLRELGNVEPELADLNRRIGGMCTQADVEWTRMVDGTGLSERAFWAQRAADVGQAFGQQWQTRDFMNWLYNHPQEMWLNKPIAALMADVHAAGLPVAALTNDLKDFHGQAWVDAQPIFREFDVIVDASVTGVLKPDPRAYQLGAEALGLDPGDIVYLDDMPPNVEGGIAAGMVTIAVDLDNPAEAAAQARVYLGISD